MQINGNERDPLSHIEIRSLTQKDMPGVQQLWDQWPAKRQFSSEIMRQYLLDYQNTLGAFEGEQLVGICQSAYDPTQMSARIYEVLPDSNFTGKGISAKLIQKTVEQYANQPDCFVVYSYVAKDNRQEHVLFTSLEFIPRETTSKYIGYTRVVNGGY